MAGIGSETAFAFDKTVQALHETIEGPRDRADFIAVEAFGHRFAGRARFEPGHVLGELIDLLRGDPK